MKHKNIKSNKQEYFNEYDIESNSTEILKEYLEIYEDQLEEHGGAANYEMVEEIEDELKKRGIKSYTGLTKEGKEYQPVLFSEVYQFYTDAPTYLAKEFDALIEGEKFEEAIEILEEFLGIAVPEKTRKQLTYASQNFITDNEREVEMTYTDLKNEPHTRILPRYGVWTMSGKDKYEVAESSNDLKYLKEKYNVSDDEIYTVGPGEFKKVKSEKGFLPREMPYALPKKDRDRAKRFWKYTKSDPVKQIGVKAFDYEGDSQMVKWAINELELAGLIDDDEVYDDMLSNAIIEILITFSEQGHSGGSASIVIPVVEKLLNWQNLTPLTTDPNEWNDVSEVSGLEEGTFFQSERNPACFSEDLIEYYDVNEPEQKYTLSEPVKHMGVEAKISTIEIGAIDSWSARWLERISELKDTLTPEQTDELSTGESVELYPWWMNLPEDVYAVVDNGYLNIDGERTRVALLAVYFEDNDSYSQKHRYIVRMDDLKIIKEE